MTAFGERRTGPGEISLRTAVRRPILQAARPRARQVRYRGFRIVTRSYRLSGSGLWAVEGEIHRNGHSRSFCQETRYLTEAEARDHSLELGRHIIDDKGEAWSVDPLRAGWPGLTRLWRVVRVALAGVATMLLLAAVGKHDHRLTHLANEIYSGTTSRIAVLGHDLYASITTGH